MAKQPKTSNEFTVQVNATLTFIREKVFGIYLLPFSHGPPLVELFIFSDLSAIRSHIMGAPRATLHTGLNNPQCYLQVNIILLFFVITMYLQ